MDGACWRARITHLTFWVYFGTTLELSLAEVQGVHRRVEFLTEILSHDLDPDFLETLSTTMAWEYYDLYRSLKKERGLTQEYRQEEFARRQGCVAVIALQRAAQKHRVPFEFMRLECNGQNKLLVKAGRVILIQESIRALGEEPKAADYKIELAELHGLVRQLELDLGDRPHRVRDWSGCVLAVLLHGASGSEFTQRHKILGSLTIGVTDASYGQWVIRVDLHRLAMFGRVGLPTTGVPAATQPDKVHVTRKRKNIRREDKA